MKLTETYSEGSEAPATLSVTRWEDAVVDEIGHDARSAYVERFWLSILGPRPAWPTTPDARRG